MARRLCEELDELKDRTDYLERVLNKYNMYRMDGRATIRGATWELSEQHIAQWTAASSLPLDDADSYARFINGGLEIRGGQVDIHTGEGNERVEIDGNGIRGYAGGVEKFKLDAATGLITATGGTIGGWTLSTNDLTGGNATLHNTGYLNLGTANDIVKLSAVDATYRIWCGHATAGSAPFRVTKAGVLYATGAILSGSMQSSNYVANVSGWQIDVSGRAEFQNVVVRGELHCAVFVKDLIDARAGTLIVAKSAGKLYAACAVPAAGPWNVEIEHPPSGGYLFEVGDVLQYKTEYTGGVAEVWCTINARATYAASQHYNCDYQAGTRNITYPAGTIAIDYGVAGQGLLRMTAEAALNGPYYEILTTAGAPWTPDFVVQSRWGNLNGSYGYGATTFGMGIGSYGVANSMTVDATNGIRFFDATPTLQAQLNAGVWTLGNTTTEHVSISATAVQFKDGAAVQGQLTGAVWTLGLAASEHISISATAVQIKDGATVHTDISGGNVTIGPVGANLSNVYITAGALSLRDNVTERIGLTAGGILTIKDSGGNAVITLNAALGAEITKKLTMPGASSAISIGATPPTASNAGTGIWIDRTGMYGLDTNVLQAKFDAVTGTITAGAGAVVLDVNGITIIATAVAGVTRAYSFVNSTPALIGGLYGYYDDVPAINVNAITLELAPIAVSRSYLQMFAEAPNPQIAQIWLRAKSGASEGNFYLFCEAGVSTYANFNCDVIIDDGLNIGTATGAGVGDIALSDDILLADGAVVGITGNEIITFNAAGTIAVSGADLIVGDYKSYRTIGAGDSTGAGWAVQPFRSEDGNGRIPFGFTYDRDNGHFNIAVGAASGGWADMRAAYKVTVSDAGAMAVVGCVTDGTCEIFTENALAIIGHILGTGSGQFDEFGHEHYDMEQLYKQYPFLIHKSRNTYFDKLGAKSDLLYRAAIQLDEYRLAADAERKTLKQRIAILETMLNV